MRAKCGHLVMQGDSEVCTADCDTYIDYRVTLTIKATTRATFAPAHRPEEVTKSDAIENAIGMGVGPDDRFPDSVYNLLQDYGFEVALPIDGEAEEV